MGVLHEVRRHRWVTLLVVRLLPLTLVGFDDGWFEWEKHHGR